MGTIGTEMPPYILYKLGYEEKSKIRFLVTHFYFIFIFLRMTLTYIPLLPIKDEQAASPSHLIHSHSCKNTQKRI